ncbi:hypothetical protein NQ314_012300 [Rhamnusium bicolor]|uniref:Uncharacterized protein n=1 Tax=Rhamnusium bicolor TaxID=1586634 RepID=A0AAV8XEW1_9CUCU|nr:hypothetical protein NQ314_012300 [Rhamnusium bicolor]
MKAHGNESGKGESRWDNIVHTTQIVIDGSTGDIACDSYNKYQEDIAMLKEIKAQYYRFSISWPRLLPTGFANVVNPAGVAYYTKT